MLDSSEDCFPEAGSRMQPGIRVVHCAGNVIIEFEHCPAVCMTEEVCLARNTVGNGYREL